MDAQELCNLQEAYMKVFINQLEEKGDLYQDREYQNRYGLPAKETKKAKKAKKVKIKDLHQNREYQNRYGESYDYYDIILSHLLDEGYAETVEAAEAIMVNMSEEWRQSILG